MVKSYNRVHIISILIITKLIPQILHVELQFLFSEHCLIMVYILPKFLENILNGLRVMNRTPFQYLVLQSGIIP